MNLYKETTEFLIENSLSWDDVEWVGVWSESHFGEIPLDKVEEMFNFEYDEGFGIEEVPLSLKVVGKDFWLERREYDGSEWWSFQTMPTKPDKLTNLKCLK